MHYNIRLRLYVVVDLNISSQDPQNSPRLNYRVYCRLSYDNGAFIVEAFAPSTFRNYICEFKGTLFININSCLVYGFREAIAIFTFE